MGRSSNDEAELGARDTDIFEAENFEDKQCFKEEFLEV